MIKSIKWLLAFVAIGLVLYFAPKLSGEQGYVLIALGNWTIEGTVVSTLALLVVVALVSVGAYLLIRHLVRWLVLPSSWWQNKRTENQRNFFQSGLDYMAMGYWNMAARQFLRVKHPERHAYAQELALVCAARAQSPELLDKFSDTSINPGQRHIARLMLLCQQGHFDQAQQILEQLDPKLAKLDLPLQHLWLQVQLQLFNWREADKHLVRIHQVTFKQSDETAANEWQDSIERQLAAAFKRYVMRHSINQLNQQWQQLSKASRRLPWVLSAYIDALADQQQGEAIETLLQHHWQDLSITWLIEQLRHTYRAMGQTHMDNLFALVQKRLNKQQDDKNLLTVYAYLAAGQKDHQLAKQALEQVIYSNNNLDDYMLYANILAELGEVRHSIEVYQERVSRLALVKN